MKNKMIILIFIKRKIIKKIEIYEKYFIKNIFN
jgi:hypothetical protein